ncbi:MAG: 4-demethylwyosine synthase TYW1 [Candidatus Micrarchaeota archaeon]
MARKAGTGSAASEGNVLTAGQAAQMRKSGYILVGGHAHSAVKVCHWTKKSIRREGECYKSKFYGIASNRCLQMSPAIPFCSHACVFCWRNTTLHNPEWGGGTDAPAEIIDACIAAQRHLLNGFPGNPAADLTKFREALDPAHAAISLDGEPTLYPLLADMVKEFHSRGITTFLVSNGSRPEAIRTLEAQGALPTQLYLSLTAPDEATFTRTSVPMHENAWRKFNESLADLARLKGKTRTVLRMTVVRGLNDSHAAGYAVLMRKSQADYVEVKAYMALGSSRKRLGPERMPTHPEIKEFARQLAQDSGYILSDEHEPSRVVLLCRDQAAKDARFIDIAAWREKTPSM